jgi:hypothetical protein
VGTGPLHDAVCQSIEGFVACLRPLVVKKARNIAVDLVARALVEDPRAHERVA